MGVPELAIVWVLLFIVCYLGYKSDKILEVVL